MELLDSVDKEFNEYEKIYLCSGFAIGLLDEMIRDITNRSRPCSRNRIIMTRFIKVLRRLNTIIQPDIDQFNVVLENFKFKVREFKHKSESLKETTSLDYNQILETTSLDYNQILEMFKDKISKLKLFKAILESESFSNKCSESLKETTGVDQLESESLDDDDCWNDVASVYDVDGDDNDFHSIISKSESYRNDLLKLITTVKSKEHLHSLLSPTKDYEDSKITLEIRKYIFEDLMSMKKILMGLISNTGASYHIREMLEPKYRFYDIDGGFDRNFAKIFIKSGAKTFYRCSGESAIFVHGEKEEEDFIAMLRVECDKLSEWECTEIFRYIKEFNLGVKENEESLKTLRSGDRTDDNLIMLHEQNKSAGEIIDKYGKMGKGTVSCILQLIIDSHAKKNNESVTCDNDLVLFFDINCDDEKDSSLKQKSQLYTLLTKIK